MASSDQQPFAAGFMDDYYAEAEEHLVAVRRNLLALEPALGSSMPAPVIEDLFRSFHSLKGISAMVELREAELLSHQIESCLRAIRSGHLTLTNDNFETLIDGAKVLDHVITAHRTGQLTPPVGRIFEQLEILAQSGDGKAGVPPDPPAITNARAIAPHTPTASARMWKVTFTPTPQLVQRGVKVDTVRTRLLQVGHILKVTPKVNSGGGVSFEFEVETDDEGQLASWADDGLIYEPLTVGAPALAPEIERAIQPAGAERAERTADSERVRAPLTVPTHFVRVDLARLDDLMRVVGDMVVTRARLDDTLQRIEAHVPFQEWRALQEHTSGIERQLRDLREGVMRVRLVPVGEIFRRMPFVVRDLARDTGKRVQLDLAGQDTEIDKFLIERMMDPVLHLVRNAISHGIESPEERVASGKPADGRIRLSASTAGESVVLEIADDGRGIDVPAVTERARAAGMLVPDGSIDSRELLDIICSSGFSTRDEADRGSGRGVGMAVVRSTVEELGGILDLETTAGGTIFTITLPLTLAITDAIIAHVGDHTFAVPQSAVREVIDVDAVAVRQIEHNELLPYRGGTLPVIRLAELFSIRTEPKPRLHGIVVGAGLAAVGVLVDRIVGQREIVVKTITDPLIRVDGVSGATELGDGRLVLILDVSALSRSLRDRPSDVAEGVPS